MKPTYITIDEFICLVSLNKAIKIYQGRGCTKTYTWYESSLDKYCYIKIKELCTYMENQK